MQDSLKSDRKIVIGMVGLPARGKTFISRKIARFLTWQGFHAKFFNLGNYRREIVGAQAKDDFFDPKNAENVKKRDEFAALALDDLIMYLKSEGEVAIYDGTNTTQKRRNFVISLLEKNLENFDLIWVESICDEEETIERNIKKAKVNNPDFVGETPDQVIEDFIKRIDRYKEAYEPTCKSDYKGIRIIKIINLGKKVKLVNIEGYLQTKIASYLINLYPYPRPIYLIKSGTTNFLYEQKCGGDDNLNEEGLKFAKYVNLFFKKEVEEEIEFKQATQPIKVLCSTLKRSYQTAEQINLGLKPIKIKNLDQINFGSWDGLTEMDIEKKYPGQYKEKMLDSYRFRYPRGESYSDLVQRIVPVIFEIERSQSPVIVVAHLSTLRCIYAYFTKNEVSEMPYIDVPYNAIIKLIPEVYFCEEKRYLYDITTGNFTEKDTKNVLDLSPKLKKTKSVIRDLEGFNV